MSVMPEGEKIGGASSKGWVKSAPLVGIGLIDLSNIGVLVAPPPRPSVPTSLYIKQELEGITYCMKERSEHTFIK